jgi:hypothetical protein
MCLSVDVRDRIEGSTLLVRYVGMHWYLNAKSDRHGGIVTPC